MTNEQIARLKELDAKATAGPWQSRDDMTTEGFVTLIGNVDGEVLDGSPSYTFDTLAICEDEYGERLPNVAANVGLILALRNALPEIIAALEGRDAMREVLELIRYVNPTVTSVAVLREIARQALARQGD